ncbi:putative clathrin assembly protein At1g03050 [Telopea speciosissima]|uniref:putative clathrin assembly protein At1g03050 n=1 Tax=Telopea speciosissima TaxID=54955 RepID=UPI001CC6C2B1|nr:putative clathrin assembly protein At1g03050 [Telopea speciosissima]
MGRSRIRKAVGAMKDKTSIGLAKVSSSSNSISDIEVAIVKATRHDEQPAEERHIKAVLCLTSYSPAYITACVNTLSRRLNKTKNWTVALKTLILIHRLLLEGDPAYESEIFFATRRGTRLLNMSDFRDTSQSNSWDFSAFVRTFALYLEDRLEFRMHGRRGRRNGLRYGCDDDEDQETARSPTVKTCTTTATPARDLKSIDRILTRVQHLQRILERFLACRPTGAAKHNRVVIVTILPLIKESIQIYHDIAEIMGIMIDRFMDLEVRDCVRIHDIFARLRKQFDELDSFYIWCKQIGIGRSSEYPEIERITAKKLEVMDEFIRDKSALAQKKRAINNHSEQQITIVPQEKEKKEEMVEQKEKEEDIWKKIKALPQPTVEKKQEASITTTTTTTTTTTQKEEADLLNLHDNNNDTMSIEEHGDKLALALFDGVPATSSASSQPPGWEAFISEDSGGDWETALVQSASKLSNQKTSLAGGFDMLLLDGMYQQQSVANATAQGAYGSTGSASSIVMSAAKPATLALPAPPVSSNNITGGVDPFAASLAVPPPAYVQMSELEKKQNLLMEEQMMWQQYARDGMQGQQGLLKLQQNHHYYGYGYGYGYPYSNSNNYYTNMGGTRSY